MTSLVRETALHSRKFIQPWVLMQQYDVLIIGSGLAGLTLALKVGQDRKVCLISKRGINDGSSNWAQGGIAAVLTDDDSTEAHIQDTLIAGAGLCDAAVTRLVAEHGRETVEWLIAEGVPFTREEDNSGFHLTREGGHSHRRIIHAADATGHAVQKTLAEKVQQHPNITVLEEHIAVDLITAGKVNMEGSACLGAYVLNNLTGKVSTIAAQQTVLATGGAGKVYLYTTNLTFPRVTVWPWPGVLAAALPIWSSSSFTPPACTIPRLSLSSSPRRCAVKVACSSCLMADAL